MQDRIRIGVVEDDALVARDLQKMLIRLDYEITFIVGSGPEAIQLIEAQYPDLLLVDIRLPQEMDGIDLVRQIQDSYDIPIIYLTAHADRQVIERIKATEPFGYLLKPVREQELHTLVEIALHKHKLAQELKETNRRLEQEIIERKQAEQSLRQSEERYRIISEAISSIAYVYRVDEQGTLERIWATEETLTQVSGFSYEEIESWPGWLALIHPDDRPQVQQHHDILRSGKQHAVEYRITTKSGDPRWIHDVTRPIWDTEQQRVTYLYGGCQDITGRKQLEAQLHHAQKMEALGQMAGGVAHHFNNMLTAVIGYIELSVMELPETHPIVTDLRQARRAAERAATLTRQLLAFTRKQVIQLQVIDLNDLVLGVEAMLGRFISSLIEFRTILSQEPIRVRVDVGQFEQVLVNLVLNARDAMPDGGLLTIQTAPVQVDKSEAHRYGQIPSGQYALLTVADNGTGMSEEVKAHIFEPFFTTKPVDKGTGLGLSTCFGIIRQHGGYIVVESELEQGTVIKVYLPRYD